MTSAPTSDVAKSDGADLYFERRGDGPLLLMITGAAVIAVNTTTDPVAHHVK